MNFYTIYIASGPAISTSHIIHTTLEPLYEEYQVPVHPDKNFGMDYLMHLMQVLVWAWTSQLWR